MTRYIVIIFTFLPLTLIAQAQFCTGTLGDNIFVEGDFGSGSANLFSPNPDIAPGYTYTFNVPPIDGQYVLTNNTASWSGLYDTWLGIRDNSTDPNGYMMVINASNTPGLFYQQAVAGLCENTLYEFSADIINLIKTGTSGHLDPNVSFLLNGVELFSTGDIPKTNSWIKYGFTFSTTVGQQSLTLALRNNAPGGIGNDLALDNISFRACGPETLIAPGASEISLCEGAAPIEFVATLMGNQYVNPAFQWQQSADEGITWSDIPGETNDTYTHPPLTTAGVYYYRFLVADGVANLSSDKCRVNASPKIIHVRSSATVQQDTLICADQTLVIGNSEYSESGIYRDTLTGFYGCDSILLTNLTVATGFEFEVDLLVTNPCPGLADGSIAIENIDGGIPPFRYSLDGMDMGSTTLFTELAGDQTYSIIIQDATGCFITRSVFIENPSELMADLMVTPPCPNQANGSIRIENVSGATPPYTFIFEGMDTGTATAFQDLPGARTYSVVIQDANACAIERSVFIENPSALTAELIVTAPCPNLTDGSILIESVSGATPPYTFIFEGVNVGATDFFSDLPGGQTYSVIVQDAIGCTMEQLVFVEDTPDLILELGTDKTIELGESVQIAPLYNFTPSDFDWQPILSPDCLSFSDCDMFDWVPVSSQQVRLDLFIDNECSIADSFFVEVLDVRKVYIPNAFSPNADGVNDNFTVFAKSGNVEMVEDLKVFNRWGALVFENINFLPNDVENGWNGTFKKEPIAAGTYIYTAAVRFVDGEILRYSGDVTVLR